VALAYASPRPAAGALHLDASGFALPHRPGQAYLVYMTAGQDVSLDLSHVTSGALRGEWWNPRTGEVGPVFERSRFEAGRTGGSASVREPVAFAPPDGAQDWALYLTAVPAAWAPAPPRSARPLPGSPLPSEHRTPTARPRKDPPAGARAPGVGEQSGRRQRSR
jgi:Putative collagen-binding domain of a collagenase